MKKETVLGLFDAYADDLYRFAFSYVKSRQDAEDIVQDVFLKLTAKVIGIRPEYEKAYLMKMTANLCRNHLKSARVRKNTPLEEAAELHAPADKSGENCYDALMTLEEIYRVPLYLHYYEDAPYSRIADMLGISSSAVAMRISRGKKILREKMEEEP